MTTPDALRGLLAALEKIQAGQGEACGDGSCVHDIAARALIAWREREPLRYHSMERGGVGCALVDAGITNAKYLMPALDAIDAALFGERERLDEG